MRWIVLGGALAAVATAPAAAQAGTVTSDGRLDFRADQGEVNNVRLFLDGGALTVTDTAALRVGAGCRLVADRRARCATPRSGALRLGDRDDTALVQVPLPLVVQGGDGNDTFMGGAVRGGPSNVSYNGDAGVDTLDYIAADGRVRLSLNDRFDDGRAGDRDGAFGIENLRGSSFGDVLEGDGGANVLEGRAGGDVLLGGDGSDTFDEGSVANGGDFIRGGEGLDWLRYDHRRRPVSVTFENRTDLANDGEAGEGDNVMDDVDIVFGGRAGDTLSAAAHGSSLIGGPGVDQITGGPEADYLDGGAGADVIGGAGGDDFILVADGEADIVDCGSDTDRVYADAPRLDVLSRCEQVFR
jgi:Ca2+-binding RTX toxin-like protein